MMPDMNHTIELLLNEMTMNIENVLGSQKRDYTDDYHCQQGEKKLELNDMTWYIFISSFFLSLYIMTLIIYVQQCVF
jgi:hypothetical protein